MQTLLDLFSLFPNRGDDPALFHRTGIRRFVYTYCQLHDLSLRMGGLLSQRGIGSGDRVLLWAPNSPWWVVAFWGCLTRGAIVVPVDFMSGTERAEAIAEMSGATLVVQSRLKVDSLPLVQSVTIEDLEHVLKDVQPLPAVANVAPGALAELVFTSGTTGAPKGVMLTHRNLVVNLLQVNHHLPIVDANFVFLSLLPLSHMFEQMGGFLTPLFRGASIAYLRALKPSAIMDAFREEDIHAVICVPRLLQLLRSGIEQRIDAMNLSGLFIQMFRVCKYLPTRLRKLLFLPIRRRFGRHFVLFVSGGAPLPPEQFGFWEAMGITVIEGYGLTECSPVLAAHSMEQRLAGSVGKVLPGVEIRIEHGEIQVRGENVFPGYYQDDCATRDAFTADGWFRTGDLGRIDQNGVLRVLGRQKELIVTGAGVNVYPDEVERILDFMPGVRESCVIGLDRGTGEEVHAVLLLDNSGNDPGVIIGAANRLLDPLQQITSFTIWSECEFPKTTTLKIRKYLVKEQLTKGIRAAQPPSADPLINVISMIAGCPFAEIQEESLLIANLGLSSIGRLELVNYLEQEYHLDLEDTVIGETTTVGDLRTILRERKMAEKSRRLRYWTNRAPLRFLRRIVDGCFHDPLVRLVASIQVRGLESLSTVCPPVVFISNHLSYLDQPAIMSALPPKWRYAMATAAREEFFFKNFRTWFGKVWKRFTYEYGTILLNLFPLSQTGGFRKSLAFMGRLVDSHCCILLFPEGERSSDGRLLPFRKGIGMMVQELSIPVVPVRISGMDLVMPPGAAWPRRGNVTVTFGKPIEFAMESQVEIVERLRQAVEELH